MLTKGLKDIDSRKIQQRSREDMVERFRRFNRDGAELKAEFAKQGLPQPVVLA
ncbi:hypothetical protein SAMN05216370_0903 [Pseudomonas peli]|uniref:Uncharacterized protein n=1 Tax=Pseudomonas peli TaxID=592361 RepID=A0AB37Z465_9PSED|nr:hypothetical protein [Pseudomonas peli]NMZ68833.1 hypothetical protein [Pseudomonas peli]SCW39276.1 hypothetical protein SAMN05216370_0903 [Pseudomonas peli]